jgi:hypothetical protein
MLEVLIDTSQTVSGSAGKSRQLLGPAIDRTVRYVSVSRPCHRTVVAVVGVSNTTLLPPHTAVHVGLPPSPLQSQTHHSPLYPVKHRIITNTLQRQYFTLLPQLLPWRVLLHVRP